MASDSSHERLTCEPRQKPAAIQAWFLNALSDTRLSRGALRTAGILMLSLARGDGRYGRLLRPIAKVNLLILDDWGPEPLTARPA